MRFSDMLRPVVKDDSPAPADLAVWRGDYPGKKQAEQAQVQRKKTKPRFGNLLGH